MKKKNNSGFSLVEMMVTAGLMGIVFAVGMKFFQMQRNDLDTATDRLQGAFDNLISEKIIARDIRHAKFSFNLISTKDENDKKIFEYFPDSICTEKCERKLVLNSPTNVGSFSKPFYMLIVDYHNPREIRFRPVNAYDSAGTFHSLNYGTSPGPLAVNYPNLWREGNLILVYSASYIRKDGADPEVIAPTMLSYIGRPKSIGINSKLKIEELVDSDTAETMLELFNPLTDSSIISEDDLFMGLGHTAGVANNTNLVSVKLVRYRLGASKTGRNNRVEGVLFRGVRGSDMNFKERVIGHGINKVTIIRKDVSSPVLNISFNE